MTEAIFRTGRAFGHNTLLYSKFDINPKLLQLDRYHSTLLDL